LKEISGGALITKILIQNGINKAFCVPGESYLGVLEAIRESKNKFDLVLSDVAPNTTGHQSTDHLRICQLIYEVIDRLEIILKNQGSFIFKIWKGEEEKEIIKMLKKIFDKVEYFKPKSSRQESSEIFIISRGFRFHEE